LRAALPWVCVPTNSLHPEGVQEPATSTTSLAPLQGAEHFGALTQGSSRCAPTTLGCIPVALQATQPAASRRAAVVASAILADVEPGFQPGGKSRRVSEAVRHARARWQIMRHSGRQDAALYGRQGCPPLQLCCPGISTAKYTKYAKEEKDSDLPCSRISRGSRLNIFFHD